MVITPVRWTIPAHGMVCGDGAHRPGRDSGCIWLCLDQKKNVWYVTRVPANPLRGFISPRTLCARGGTKDSIQ